MNVLRQSLLTLALVCLFGVTSATAATVDFLQDGWSAGPLTVSFTGDDADADGLLEATELSSFSAIYYLPQGGFTQWLTANIQPDGFQFTDLGNYLISTRNADYSLVSASFEGLALASVIDDSLFLVDTTEASPNVVPEPGGLAVLGVAAITLAARLRHGRSSRIAASDHRSQNDAD